MSVVSRLRKRTTAVVAIATLSVLSASHAFGALASYVFTTEYDGKTYLSKFDGTSMIADFAQYSGGGLQSGRNSSGSGISLISGGSFTTVVNPGAYGNGLSDIQEHLLVGPWINPEGRHGQLASGPDFGIYRGTSTNAGAPGKTLFSAQSIGQAITMGDLATDIFSGGADGHTYIQGHTSNSYIDLGAFTIVAGEQVGNGAIVEKSTGGIYYIKPDGTQTLVTGVTNLEADGVGAKFGNYGFFNADGKAWHYDSLTNTATSYSGLSIHEAVRIGSLALVQYYSGIYLYDSANNESLYLSSSGGNYRMTDALSFGDYALIVIDGETRVYRDNGAGGLDSSNWTGVALDLSRATGDYLGVAEVPEPAALGLLGLGILVLRRRQ